MVSSLCVFCASRLSNRPEFQTVAKELGHELGKRGIELVYGGGKTGLMGIIADAALEAGGSVFGVMPSFMITNEIAHTGITELRIVSSMHERKAIMASRAKAFVSLPGGTGTLDETFEILTWRQLQLHHNPVYLFNINGYYNHLLQFLETAKENQLILPEHRNLLASVSSVQELFQELEKIS